LTSYLSEVRETKRLIALHKNYYLSWKNAFVNIQVIKIRQNSKIQTYELSQKNKANHFFHCSCGAKISIVSNMYLMSKIINRHLVEHRKLCGPDEILTEIIKALYTQI